MLGPTKSFSSLCKNSGQKCFVCKQFLLMLTKNCLIISVLEMRNYPKEIRNYIRNIRKDIRNYPNTVLSDVEVNHCKLVPSTKVL